MVPQIESHSIRAAQAPLVTDSNDARSFRTDTKTSDTKTSDHGADLSIATSITRDVRVPLSNLTTAELLDRATELSCMAGTATTADTRDALHRLAIRFVELAQERAGTGGRPEPC